MNIKSGLMMAVMLFILSACQLDHYFPNDLKGKVRHGIYTTHVGYTHDKFDIAVPQENNQFEINTVPAEEKYKNNYTYVMFGATKTEDIVYRLMVVKKCHMSLAEFKATYFPQLIKISARGDDREMFRTYHTPATILGHPAIFNMYTQTVRGLDLYINTKEPGLVTLTHAVYFVDFDDYGVIFWIQASSESPLWGITRANIKAMRQQNWLPMVQFVRSFKLFRAYPH